MKKEMKQFLEFLKAMQAEDPKEKFKDACAIAMTYSREGANLSVKKGIDTKTMASIVLIAEMGENEFGNIATGAKFALCILPPGLEMKENSVNYFIPQKHVEGILLKKAHVITGQDLEDQAIENFEPANEILKKAKEILKNT